MDLASGGPWPATTNIGLGKVSERHRITSILPLLAGCSLGLSPEMVSVGAQVVCGRFSVNHQVWGEWCSPGFHSMPILSLRTLSEILRVHQGQLPPVCGPSQWGMVLDSHQDRASGVHQVNTD